MYSIPVYVLINLLKQIIWQLTLELPDFTTHELEFGFHNQASEIIFTSIQETVSNLFHIPSEKQVLNDLWW